MLWCSDVTRPCSFWRDCPSQQQQLPVHCQPLACGQSFRVLSNQPRTLTPSHLLHPALTHEATIPPALSYPAARYQTTGDTAGTPSPLKSFQLPSPKCSQPTCSALPVRSHKLTVRLLTTHPRLCPLSDAGASPHVWPCMTCSSSCFLGSLIINAFLHDSHFGV